MSSRHTNPGTLLADLAIEQRRQDRQTPLGIVGAFLAGLSVDASVRDKPASAKLNFLGKSLFIPNFLYRYGLPGRPGCIRGWNPQRVFRH
jgi:hypothetical protein